MMGKCLRDGRAVGGRGGLFPSQSFTTKQLVVVWPRWRKEEDVDVEQKERKGWEKSVNGRWKTMEGGGGVNEGEKWVQPGGFTLRRRYDIFVNF